MILPGGELCILKKRGLEEEMMAGNTARFITPAQPIQTVLSNIYDVNDRTLYIAKGPPCQNEYVTLDFSDIL